MKFLFPISLFTSCRSAWLITSLALCSPILAQVAVEEPQSSASERATITPDEAAILQSNPSPANTYSAVADGANAIPGQAVADTPRRFQYTLSLLVRGIYDDNINNSSINHVSDVYFAIEPVVTLGFGGPESASTVSLIYRPSLFVFVDHSENDTVQQLIRAQAAHRFGHLALSFSQDVQLLDGTDLNSLSDPTGHQANNDVTGRARHEIYTSTLSASYDLTGKLSLSGGAAFYADVYRAPLISSGNVSGNLFINYNYSEKLIVGLGGTGGYSTTDNSGPFNNDETFEQANVRVNYSATAKITLSASGGIEFRQSSNGSNDNVSPVYELDASYQPFDGTSLTLSGSRRTYNSASLAGQDYADTTINFAITQRVLQRFFVGLAVGYNNNNYFSTVNGVNSTKNDDFYYIDPSIDFNITRFWTFGGYYVHRENTSSAPFFSFTDNQFGFRTKLTF